MLDLTPILSRVHRGHCWVKTPDGPRRIAEPLDDGKVQLHLAGKRAYGACPIAPGTSTTRLALLDLDSHKGETPWEEMLSIAESITVQLQVREMNATLWRSSGGSGIHIFLLWDTEQDAFSVRESMRQVLADCLLASGTGGVAKGEVEIFPKQAAVASDGFGSMFILPGAGKSDLISGEWKTSAPIPTIPKPERAPHTGDIHGLENLLAALDAIPNRDADSLDYDLWRNIVFAIHHATDGSDSGLALAHRFSSRSPKYDPAFLDERVWPYVRSDRDDAITARTIFHTARAYGFVEDVSDDFDVVSAPDQPAPGSGRFRVVPAHEFSQRPAPSWIVKDILPRAELAVVFGESGSGKSFLALDLVAAIARGAPWRGNVCQRGRVVYVAAEGAGGFRNRLVAYAHQFAIDLAHLDVGVVPEAPNLLKIDDTTALIAAIKVFGLPTVVVLDTWAQVTPGGNENSGEDVGKALGHCKRIHTATGALVILIHHSGKDATKGARGWSGLRAAADCEIEIVRSNDDRVATITKLKDGEDGAEFGFKLLTVHIDDEHTSCVVEHGAAVARENRTREPKGTKEKLVLRTVLETLGEGNVADIADVVDVAVNQLPHDPLAGRRDTRRQHILRAMESLQSAGRLVIDGVKVSLPQ